MTISITALIVDLIPILNQTGSSVVQQIRNNLAATGTNATGRTSRSLRFEVTTNGNIARLRILGRPYFMTVETGRKATPEYTKPSRDFVQQIKDWLAAKGGDQGAAYAIAKSIHKHGTKLWQKGGRNDITSNVVNQSLYSQINAAVLNEFVKAYIAALKT